MNIHTNFVKSKRFTSSIEPSILKHSQEYRVLATLRYVYPTKFHQYRRNFKKIGLAILLPEIPTTYAEDHFSKWIFELLIDTENQLKFITSLPELSISAMRTALQMMAEKSVGRRNPPKTQNGGTVFTVPPHYIFTSLSHLG